MPSNAHHVIDSVVFNRSTMWFKSILDVTVTAILRIDSGFLTSMSVDVVKVDGTKVNVLPLTTPSADSQRVFTVDRSNFAPGSSTVIVTFVDQTPPAGGTGVTTFTHSVIVDDRDDLVVTRSFDFKPEYLVSGPGKVDPVGHFSVTTSRGFEQAMMIPTQPVLMDGRATVRTITVTGDADAVGQASKTLNANGQVDAGDVFVQTISLNDVLSFRSIDKIQVVDAAR